MAEEQLGDNACAATNNAFSKHTKQATRGIASYRINAAEEIQSTTTAVAHQTINGANLNSHNAITVYE